MLGKSVSCAVSKFRPAQASVVYLQKSSVWYIEYENVLMQKLIIGCDEEGRRVSHDTCVAEHSNNHSLYNKTGSLQVQLKESYTSPKWNSKGRVPEEKSKNKQTWLHYAEIQEPSDLVCKLQLE